MTGPDDAVPFGRALRDAVRPRDCLALAVVPVVAVAVFALPVGTRESLTFVYRDPSFYTAYTAHFVHFEVEHLVGNVLGYGLLASVGYVLAALAGYRRLFGAAAMTYVLAFPPALSALNLAVPRNAVGYGLSGVNMAFAGLLGLVLVAYLSRLDDRLDLRYAPGVFFATVALVSVVALPNDDLSLGITGVSVVLAAGYAVSARRSLTGVPDRRTAAGWPDAGVLGGVAFVGYQFVGFPAPSPDGSVVNLYVHLLGLCLGFIVPYTALSAGIIGADD